MPLGNPAPHPPTAFSSHRIRCFDGASCRLALMLGDSRIAREQRDVPLAIIRISCSKSTSLVHRASAAPLSASPTRLLPLPAGAARVDHDVWSVDLQPACSNAEPPGIPDRIATPGRDHEVPRADPALASCTSHDVSRRRSPILGSASRGCPRCSLRLPSRPIAVPRCPGGILRVDETRDPRLTLVVEQHASCAVQPYDS